MLVSNGADVNQADKDGDSSLHRAAIIGHDAVVVQLLSNGADVNQGNNDGDSPLHIAANYSRDSVIAVLLSKGADVNQTNNNGKKPIDLTRNQRSKDMLIAYTKEQQEQEEEARKRKEGEEAARIKTEAVKVLLLAATSNFKGLSSDQIGDLVVSFGEQYLSYRDNIVTMGLTGAIIAHAMTNGTLHETLKAVGVTNIFQLNALEVKFQSFCQPTLLSNPVTTPTATNTTNTTTTATTKDSLSTAASTVSLSNVSISEGAAATTSNSGDSISASTLTDIPWEEIHVEPSSTSDDENLLGSGSFGHVYGGKWQQIQRRKVGCDVAIKVVTRRLLKNNARSKHVNYDHAMRCAIEEAELICKVQNKPVISEFVMPVYGFAKGLIPPDLITAFQLPAGDEGFGIVMKLAAGGTLSNLLHGEKERSLSMYDQLCICAQLVRGMFELHAEGLVHGDMKPDNILFADSSLTSLKIADFGTAKLRGKIDGTVGRSALQVTSHNHGTPIYSAPEMLKEENGGVASANRSTDMYAVAIIMHEVLSRDKPFEDVSQNSLLFMQYVVAGGRPPIKKLPEETPAAVKDMIEQCWDGDRTKRLSSYRCVEILARELKPFEQQQILSRPTSPATEPMSVTMARRANDPVLAALVALTDVVYGIKENQTKNQKELIGIIEEGFEDVKEEVKKEVKIALFKLDKISDQIEEAKEFQRMGFEILQQQAKRYHEEDKDYFKAQAAMLDAQFELLKSVDGKIDGLSEQVAKGFLKMESTFDRVGAKLATEIMANGDSLLNNFKNFQTQLDGMQADSLDETKITELVKNSMSSMGEDITQKLTESMVEVMTASGNGDFTQQEKLEHLIEMVSSTHNQVKDMQKGLSELSTDMQKELSDLSEKQTIASIGAVNPKKIIMPRTFILLPYKTEEVPVPSNATTQVADDVDVVQLALASSSSSTAVGWFKSKAGQAMQGVKQKLKEGYGSAKDTANSIANRAMRVCWKTLRVQFICPVTMQPAPMVEGGPCIITLPTDTLIYSAKALKYGTILLKIVLATQGLGGVVPDISSLIPAEIMDPKELIKQMEDMGNFAEEQYNSVKGKVAGSLGSVGQEISGVVQAGADKELAQLRDKFQNVFDGAAESDGTSNMLAIYKLIAKARGQKSLEVALQNTWQPLDKDHRKWGMVLVQPKGSDTWIWASEEGAKLLKKVGMVALDPKADVNRETVKTGSTMTEFAASTAGAAAEAMAKKAGIDVMGIKTKCKSYGIAPEAIVCIVASPLFIQILLAVSSKDNAKAEGLAEGPMKAEIMKATKLSDDQVDALLQLFLSGGTDWSGLDTLEQVGVIAGVALWEAAKKVPSLKIQKIEQHTEQECGMRSGEVEKIFVAAVSDPAFKDAVCKLMNNDRSGATFVLTSELLRLVAMKTDLPLDTINAVIDAILTGSLAKLEEVGDHGPKALWALVKQATSLKISAIERRTVKECDFRSGDVEAIFVAAVDSPVFKSAIEALISGNSDSAAFRQFKGNEFAALVDGIAEKTGISLPEIEMVLSALITSDLTKLQPLATGTQTTTPVEERGLKVLWALVERFKIIRVDKIERCAKKCGLRPVDVESIFIVAMSDAVFKDTICKLMNNDHSGVTQQSRGLTFLLHFVATKIGKPLDTINAVIDAILTGSLAKLEEVGDHGPKALWALVK